MATKKRASGDAHGTPTCCFEGKHAGKLHEVSITGSGDHAREAFICDEHLASMQRGSPDREMPQTPGLEIDESQVRYENRRQGAFERFGTDHPKCALCGETDWRCMERHHVAGKDFDEFSVTVCRNCHRKLSDAQREHPEFGRGDKTFETIGRLLLGIADLLVLLSDKLVEIGRWLIELAKADHGTAQ